MNKEKIFELKIEDEDELSGIDSISLVDEPAIEVNWIAFNKTKQEDFHIPDGEDEIYLEKLIGKAENEQDLFDAGYVIESITLLKDKFASTNPNANSDWDEDDVKIRYKYILNPRINERAIINTTRSFCKELINKNFVWRIEDMESTTNDFGQSALVWRGGYNCRHVWSQIRYKKDATIVNKASVNKGKETEAGFPTDMTPNTNVLGYPQPSTVTSKTAANPSPSTVRNLGLSKVYDFIAQKVSIDYDDTLSTERGKELAKRMLKEGKDVSIITRRQSDQLEEVYKTADELGIPRDKVHATNGKLKWETIKKLGIEKHIDNNQNEIDSIKEHTPEVEAQKFEVGVPHYTEDGKLYEGPTHKDANGRLMTGAVHSEDSVYLYHADELIICKKCQHSWVMEDGGDKPYMCNKCGYDNASEYNMGYDVGGIGGYVDPGVTGKTGNTISKSLTKPTLFENYSDYPDSIKNNAKAVLKYVEENGWGSCGTPVGKMRVNQLAKGEPISEDTIKRMYSYLSRHEVDLDSSKSYDDGCGKLMYDSWGGKSALSWSESKIKSIDREKMSKQKFATDDEKRIVVGPAMVPDLKIFRKDSKGNPYFVFFSSKTIKMIMEKYMRNKYTDNNDENHNGNAVKDVYVIESWIKEDMEDKSNKYGYSELPIGTWFVSMKVRNDEVWQKVKKGELNGFSVSGYFEEVAQFCMEEMFLKQVVDILKNIKD